MKGRITRSITFCIAIAMIMAPSVSRVYAGRAGGDTYPVGSDVYVERAEVKPSLSLSRLEVPIDKISDEQVVEMTIEGAAEKYAPTGLHIKFDDRLELLMDDGDYAEKGPALKRLSGTQYPDFCDDEGVLHGMFLTTSAKENYGRDGVMWRFRVKLPEDAKVGDEYPIELLFKRNVTINTQDVFTNCLDDKSGKLMEAWLFTRGVEQGYIRVIDKVEEAEETEEVEEVVEKKAPKGDLNGDGVVDAVDASRLLSNYATYSTGIAVPTEEDIYVSDVNGDGMIDAIDASNVLAYYAFVSSGGTLTFEEFLTKK